MYIIVQDSRYVMTKGSEYTAELLYTAITINYTYNHHLHLKYTRSQSSSCDTYLADDEMVGVEEL